jgi:hypothetical protein
MNPRGRSIIPDPEEHWGQCRLQLFVNSVLIESGIPEISVLPVIELLRYEYPSLRRLTGLIRLLTIRKLITGW